MKSILERALVHLLNEENEKAEELLHQFVIEQARNIHETLRESDDSDMEDLEEGDEFFTEADLADAETADDATDDLGDDLGAEPELSDAGDLGDDTLDGEEDHDVDPMANEGGEDDIQTEIDDFEKELADLQAKFDSMVAQMGGEDVADDDDLGADDLGADDLGGDVVDDGTESLPVSDDGDVSAEGEDEFDDITESIVDELQKVTVPNTEGKGANGEQLLHNTNTNLPKTKGEPHPSVSKGGEHKGYARETSPSTTPLKGGKTVSTPSVRNVRASADSGNSKVSKEGDARATLNKAPPVQDKSVIPGKGKKK